MANQIAMMAGKRFLSKKLADDAKDSGVCLLALVSHEGYTDFALGCL